MTLYLIKQEAHFGWTLLWCQTTWCWTASSYGWWLLLELGLITRFLYSKGKREGGGYLEQNGVDLVLVNGVVFIWCCKQLFVCDSFKKISFLVWRSSNINKSKNDETRLLSAPVSHLQYFELIEKINDRNKFFQSITLDDELWSTGCQTVSS